MDTKMNRIFLSLLFVTAGVFAGQDDEPSVETATAKTAPIAIPKLRIESRVSDERPSSKELEMYCEWPGNSSPVTYIPFIEPITRNPNYTFDTTGA
jgi:hypothetical protein